jgi:hypothetical protein
MLFGLWHLDGVDIAPPMLAYIVAVLILVVTLEPIDPDGDGHP